MYEIYISWYLKPIYGDIPFYMEFNIVINTRCRLYDIHYVLYNVEPMHDT